MPTEKPPLQKHTRMMIAAIILLAFFVIFVGIITAYIKRFNRELEDESQTHLSEVASYISAYMTSAVTDTQESLKSAASAIALMDDGQTRMDYLQKIGEQYSFAYIGCAGMDGKLYATVDSESVDVSGEEYFKAALRGENTVSNLTRKIFKDRAASGILLAVPLGKDKDSPKGVLVAMMEISQLSSALTLESFGGEGYPYVFDKNGTIIMRTRSLDFNNLFNVWQTLDYKEGYSYEEFYDNVMNDRAGLARYTYLGVDKYAYYSALPFNDWSIVNIVDEAAVSARANSLTQELIFIGVIMVISFVGLIFTVLHAYSASQDSKAETNAKSAFLANMSHEIRTPMNAIVGLSEILLRDDLTQGQRSKVLNVLNSGKGLLTIINDILDLSKIESGKFTIIEDPYEIESMLYDLTVIAAMRIGEKPVEFLIEIDPTLPRSFVGDMGRVKQVLLNIVGNAIKFTNSGSIRLIMDGKQEADAWTLRMEIKDTGIGIKGEDLDKLFGSFDQVDTRRNRNVEGTGLGLSISKRLCEMMGGRITVTSEYGKGSSFIATIRQSAAPGTQEAAMPNEGFSLLVCEASEILREYEINCMDRLGLQYDMCATPEEFAEKLKNTDYSHALAAADILNRQGVPEGNIHPITLYKLNEHTLIDSGAINIYIPLFPMQLPYALRGLNENIHALKNVGISMNTIEPMPYVSILIVDDNPVNIEVAKGLMEPYNMQMDAASSGSESIEAVQNKSYDLILMDHMMPVMSGIDAMKHIRALSDERFKTLPIVALTANATNDARRLFMKEGFDDFLSKPIETQKLDGILRKYLKPLNSARAALNPVPPASAVYSPAPIPSPWDCESAEVKFQEGMERMGSFSVYIMILETYLRSTKEKLPQLSEWLNTDKERFVIEIHGLKSAGAAIGADALSTLAKDMEQRGKEGRFADMEKSLTYFLKQSEAVLGEVEKYLVQAKKEQS